MGGPDAALKDNDDLIVWIGAIVAVSVLGLLGYLALHQSSYVTPSGQNPLRPHAGQPVSYLLVGTENLEAAGIAGRLLRVIVPVGISRVDLDATLRQAVTDERHREPMVGEITVYAYGPNDDTRGHYTYGKLDWVPEDRYSEEIAAGLADKN